MSRYRDVVSLFFAKKRRQAIKLGVITFITLNKTGNLFTIINIVWEIVRSLFTWCKNGVN